MEVILISLESISRGGERRKQRSTSSSSLISDHRSFFGFCDERELWREVESEIAVFVCCEGARVLGIDDDDI